MSMAIKYQMMKKAKGDACSEHGSYGCQMCHGGMAKMAEGGEVDDEDAMIARIIRKRAGMAEPEADFESNDFDVLDQESPGTAADETVDNSGDEIGDEKVEGESKDVVDRIMRKRKGSMPRPA